MSTSSKSCFSQVPGDTENSEKPSLTWQPGASEFGKQQEVAQAAFVVALGASWASAGSWQGKGIIVKTHFRSPLRIAEEMKSFEGELKLLKL